MSLDEHVIIFSQWDNLLKEVGIVLNEYGIKNLCLALGLPMSGN